MRHVVLIRGSVEGMGRTAWCDLLAMKECPSETAAPTYSRCCVLDAPADLPDGHYKVTFAGNKVSAEKQAGLWLPADDAVPVGGEPRRERSGSWETDAGFLGRLRKHTA